MIIESLSEQKYPQELQELKNNIEYCGRSFATYKAIVEENVLNENKLNAQIKAIEKAEQTYYTTIDSNVQLQEKEYNEMFNRIGELRSQEGKLQISNMQLVEDRKKYYGELNANMVKLDKNRQFWS